MDELLFIEAVKKISLNDSQIEKLKGSCCSVKRRNYVPRCIAAACVGLLVFSGIFLWIEPIQKSTDSLSAGSLGTALFDTGIMENMADIARDEVETVVQPADIIRVNEVDDNLTIDSSRVNYDVSKYERIIWNWEQVEEYYGRELNVDPLPGDMILSPYASQQVEIVLERDTGNIVEDTVLLEYWNDWKNYENDIGRRLIPEGGRGFTVLVSKIGILQCGIMVPEEELKMSLIDGTEVLIGHRVMGTLFNEEHEPEFTYDVYQAQFTYDSVEYEVTTEAMTLEELANIIKAIIPE